MNKSQYLITINHGSDFQREVNEGMTNGILQVLWSNVTDRHKKNFMNVMKLEGITEGTDLITYRENRVKSGDVKIEEIAKYFVGVLNQIRDWEQRIDSIVSEGGITDPVEGLLHEISEEMSALNT